MQKNATDPTPFLGENCSKFSWCAEAAPHRPDQHTGHNRVAGPPRPQPKLANDMTLDDVEQRLPIPHDVIVTLAPDLPSGNAWWHPEHRVMLVKPGLGPAERAITLAHETAHILLGHHGDLMQDRDIETEADTLAAVLLLGAVASPSRRRRVRGGLLARGVQVPA